MIEVMVKIAAVGILATLFAAVLRKQVSELALVLTLAGGAWMLWTILEGLGMITSVMDQLAQLAGLEQEVLEPMLKTVALSLLTRLTVEICQSAGERGIAAFVETAGTVLALVVGLPLVQAVLDLVERMLG